MRVYEVPPNEDLKEIDDQFKNLLKTAGHKNPKYQKVAGRNEVGTEWFLTNTDFLDTVATTMKLKTAYTTS